MRLALSVSASRLSGFVAAGACVPVVCSVRASLVSACRAQDHPRQFRPEKHPTDPASVPTISQALPALAFVAHVFSQITDPHNIPVKRDRAKIRPAPYLNR